MPVLSPAVRRKAGRLAVALAALALAACSVDVADPNVGGGFRPSPSPERACTREYAPVCAARGRERQTFANACEARSSGYDIIGRGECQITRPDRDRDRDRDRGEWREGDRERDGRDRDRDGRDRNDRDRADRDRPRDQRVCTMEYNPVCGQQGRDRRTFGNACSAEVAGFRVVRPGECPAR